MIPPQNFNIKENYYLVEQQSMLSMNSKKVNYKMIQKYGIYKKTIKRDLNFGARIKQVKATSLTKDTIVLSALLNNNIETSIGFNPKQSNKSIKQIRK